MRGIYFQHRQDPGASVELQIISQFIDPTAAATGIAVVEFSGKLKGVVDFIFTFAVRVFADKPADMVGHGCSSNFADRLKIRSLPSKGFLPRVRPMDKPNEMRFFFRVALIINSYELFYQFL